MSIYDLQLEFALAKSIWNFFLSVKRIWCRVKTQSTFSHVLVISASVQPSTEGKKCRWCQMDTDGHSEGKFKRLTLGANNLEKHRSTGARKSGRSLWGKFHGETSRAGELGIELAHRRYFNRKLHHRQAINRPPIIRLAPNDTILHCFYRCWVNWRFI